MEGRAGGRGMIDGRGRGRGRDGRGRGGGRDASVGAGRGRGRLGKGAVAGRAPAAALLPPPQLQIKREAPAPVKEEEQSTFTFVPMTTNVKKDDVDMPAGYVAHAGATATPSVAEGHIEDPYDPTVPNDYMKLHKERELKRSHERRERQRQQHLERLEKEQEALQSTVQPVEASSHPTVSNLPAWMKKESSEPPSEPAPPKPAPKKSGLNKRPTRVLLLKNMVPPGDVDADLPSETRAECAKYGEVEACEVLELTGVHETEAVRIYVQFKNKNDAVKAFLDLEGRFFAGRKIACAFFDEERFAKNDLAPTP